MDNLIAFILLNLPASVRQEILSSETLELVRSRPERFVSISYEGEIESPFLRLLIDDITASKYKYHIRGETEDDKSTNQLFSAL